MAGERGESLQQMRLISDTAWNSALGAAAQHIGRRDFHKTLLRLLGMLIQHDMTFIGRYSRFSPVELLHYEGVPHHVVALFRRRYHGFDPFHAWWRRNGEPGVVTLSMTIDESADDDPYRRTFQRQAHIRDEICMFLPVIGGASLGLFLERSRNTFTEAEIRRARSVYPVIAGLYRAHLGRLFTLFGNKPDVRAGRVLPLPTMLVDRAGCRVFSNTSWRDLEDSPEFWPSVAQALESLRRSGRAEAALPNGQILAAEAMGDDFPVAPEGKLYLIRNSTAMPSVEMPKSVAVTPIGKQLTTREQQITDLILQGYTSEAIARKLGIGRGTVKNHRRRLYYKLDITSERELFLLYLDSLPNSARGP